MSGRVRCMTCGAVLTATELEQAPWLMVAGFGAGEPRHYCNDCTAPVVDALRDDDRAFLIRPDLTLRELRPDSDAAGRSTLRRVKL